MNETRRTRLLIDVPPALVARVQAAAEAEGTSVNAWVRGVLTAALTLQDVDTAIAGGLRSLIRGILDDGLRDIAVAALYAVAAARLAAEAYRVALGAAGEEGRHLADQALAAAVDEAEALLWRHRPWGPEPAEGKGG